MDAYKDQTRPDVDDFIRIPSVKAILQNPKHVLELVSLTGRHLYINTAIRDLYGYTPEEFIKINGWDLTHPDDASVLMESRQALARGPIRMVLRGRHKSGIYQWVDARLMLQGDLVSVITAPYEDVPPDKAFWEYIDPFI